MKNAHLLEVANIKSLNFPSDADTAINSSRVSLKNGQRCSLILHFADSTAAVVTASLKQHNAATSGTTKALEIDNPYYHKVGAATEFTKVQPTAKEDEYDLASLLASEPGVVVFEILSEDLDVDNGFAWVSVNLADTTAAKLTGILAIIRELAYHPGYDQDL